MFTNADRAVRALRLFKGWSQHVLGDRAQVSREIVSRLERGQMNGMTLQTLDRVAAALGATVHVQIRWHGERLDQLLDARHASIQQAIADLLARLGWLVRVEVSFNHYGDRGRIDVVAYHPGLRIVLVVEVKSALGDLQEPLGRLDVKARLGRQVARELGWTDVSSVIPMLVIGESRAARRVLARHAALFGRYPVRGRQAVAWLRNPVEPIPTGLLLFANHPYSHQVTTKRGDTVLRRPHSHLA